MDSQNAEVMGCARDWTLLPLELLIMIASRIECLQDLVMFSAVCPLWYTAYSKAKSTWTPKMPWLMLAVKPEDDPRCLRTVYDPAAKKQYQMELPKTFGRYCHGCGDGWVLTLGLDMEMHLFNPHTRAHLSLPSAETLPDLDLYIDPDDPEDRTKARAEVVKRVTLLTRSIGELMVVLVYNDVMVTFARRGDSSWRDPKDFVPALILVRDVVPCGNNVTVVYLDGVVAAFDVDAFFDADPIPVEGKKYEPEYETDWIEAYCVQSGKDLLALEEHAELTDLAIGMLTIHYYVFKFDFKTLEWKQIHELGHVALFVGNNTPIALRASKSPPCRPKCIYFTESRFPDDDIKVIGKDMGVFRLDDYFVDGLYEGDGVVASEFCPPSFYTPFIVYFPSAFNVGFSVNNKVFLCPSRVA